MTKLIRRKTIKKTLKKIVSDTIGIPLKGNFTSSEFVKERQRFKLIRSNRYSALTEVSSKANYFNGISGGDNYTFGEGENSYLWH